MAPLQFVRVIRNGELERFAFGEDSETGEKHDERCVYPEECLVLSKLRENIADEEFGYRYKVLWDGIAAFLQPSDLSNADSIYVYLVQIDRGPLFAGVRYRSEGSSGLESGGLALQFYLPLDTPYGNNFPWPGVGRAYDISESHTSSMLELAKLWLHECTSGTDAYL
ncbi:hypothetical protein CGGC5_v016449 [Colletotrichum fructicola Nara gc5]|uniref:Uncharacterized protein n=1 Tax=Colletotrichum fructicola (strain Nara gc5) TaxID=1213859 RepID=A0A7J6IEP8_COLFN|nr:hypothetical protein CGGC5_v016449 [Colletotrichum fructicola Nara gc5]